MHFRGTAFQQKKWTDKQKLENDLKLHKELDLMYETITKLAIVCIRKNLPLNNMILEAYSWNKKKIINNTSSKTERSLISKEYANRFIREFIVDVKE